MNRSKAGNEKALFCKTNINDTRKIDLKYNQKLLLYFLLCHQTLQSRIVSGMSIGSKITMKSGNTPIQCGT